MTSEWDTQIGKQLRKLSINDQGFKSRIFSTNIGIRPAEPCTLSVIATYLFVGLKETHEPFHAE